ncbi:MAG: hypothetical protein NZ733_03555 [Aigarchaeota archaeon]|nr:hypothetical protein [Aigarchaeota archaeon]MCX8203231.1 hypothetical protein [Nitrososphaeria archaeon]MDW8043331.1 RNA-binding domain-containing protein [Nitrososphaerota archaeon]
MRRVTSVTARAICSATESEEKVLRAMSNALGVDVSGAARWTRTTGIFGEPLSVVEVELRGEGAEAVAERLLSYLPEHYVAERTEVLGSQEVIHVRLDKQAAYLGELVLSERDAIKVEVRRQRA